LSDRGLKPDLNFKLFPSGIKPFVPTRGTVEDISSLFGSLQEMKIPQVQSDIDFEVVNSGQCHIIDLTRNLIGGCDVVIVNVYLS
jgi:hypothetical protein